MASFVEQATLLVNDQSTKPLSNINKAIKAVLATSKQLSGARIAGMRVDRQSINSINQASRAAKNLSIAVKAANNRTIGPKVNKRSINDILRATNAVKGLHGASRRSSVPLVSLTGIKKAQGEVARLQAQLTALRNSRAQVNVQGFGRRFPGNLPAIGNRVLGYDAVLAARETARTGARAVGERSSETFTQRALGINESKISELNKLARDASAGLLMTSETQARMVARNLIMAGATEDTVRGLTRAQLEVQQSTNALLGAAQAERFGEQVVKIVDLAGKLDQESNAEKIVRALGASQLVAGRDLKFNQVLNAFRNTAGLVMGMTENAMQDFVFAVEEGGRRTAQGLRSFDRELNSNNVAKKNLNMLIQNGLRTPSGAVDADLQTRDFTAWIDKHITGKARSQGVDLDNLAAVRKFIGSLGFMQSATTFLSSEVLKREERKRARQRAKQIKFDKIQAKASKDIIGAAKMVKAQFQDLSANALTPFTNAVLSPALVDIAKRLDGLSRGEFSARNVAGVAYAGAGAGAVLAATNPGTVALALAGLKLNKAGTSLTAAAAALTRSSVGRSGAAVVAGGKDKDGRKNKRNKQRGLGKVGKLAKNPFVAAVAGIAAVEYYGSDAEAMARAALGKLDRIDAAIRGIKPTIDGVKKSDPKRIPPPTFRPPPLTIEGGKASTNAKSTVPTFRPESPVAKAIKELNESFAKLPGFQKQDDLQALVRGIAAEALNVKDTRDSLSSKGVNNVMIEAVLKNNIASMQRNQEILSATFSRGETISSVFGADVERGAGVAQSFSQATNTAGANIMGAFSEGAGFAANAIRSALSTPVNVRVSQTGGGRTANTGDMQLSANP